jgi:hypothetical protein
MKDKGIARVLSENDIHSFLDKNYIIESYNLKKISLDYINNKWVNEWIIYSKIKNIYI